MFLSVLTLLHAAQPPKSNEQLQREILEMQHRQMTQQLQAGQQRQQNQETIERMVRQYRDSVACLTGPHARTLSADFFKSLQGQKDRKSTQF